MVFRCKDSVFFSKLQKNGEKNQMGHEKVVIIYHELANLRILFLNTNYRISHEFLMN